MSVESIVRETCEAQLLRYACGARIFCPVCEGVLDCQTAVLLRSPAVAMCGGCFEASVAQHSWRLDPDPYGLHGMPPETRQAEIDSAVAKLIDIDGRQIDWEVM